MVNYIWDSTPHDKFDEVMLRGWTQHIRDLSHHKVLHGVFKICHYAFLVYHCGQMCYFNHSLCVFVTCTWRWLMVYAYTQMPAVGGVVVVVSKQGVENRDTTELCSTSLVCFVLISLIQLLFIALFLHRYELGLWQNSWWPPCELTSCLNYARKLAYWCIDACGCVLLVWG